MKVVYLEHPHSLKNHNCPPSCVALGFFDGIHLGHQKVILGAREKANELNLECAVMTLDPHPSVVLRRTVQHVRYITPLTEKIRLLEQMGVDTLYVVKFDLSFASLVPQDFVDQYIIALNIMHVVAGFDYSYGSLGKGTMETLPFHSRNQFDQTVIEKYTTNDLKVSSTYIRQQLQEGNVNDLPSTLGRFYQIRGRVGHGEKRGRTIGFPTANITLTEDYVIPKTGVYAVRMYVLGRWHNGVCNIGYKPTFHENKKDVVPSIEVHLFHFQDVIYEEEVTIEWHQNIRDEKKFSGIEALVEQITKDKETAEDYFQKNTCDTCFLT
ncbi:bifunctional riboflavin kinase/FAD synthetase [Sutcliffiella rhizosphaerae]|uniref:Riboflavin biosynthesis protein n=1 Tax=Sutcliffiella rhizosphaerae TaxID=2880967 RepID=A0ABN8A6Y4_9BACI|nr:bifunctional riboflavin kinase/FAD synthetase [Sutcliffiella rhizosphaerae]CAG9619667.1 Bifunctional riboflavin kinase/FMN adenylyltransferase [Sutcliffiella rhizosphaerae]